MNRCAQTAAAPRQHRAILRRVFFLPADLQKNRPCALQQANVSGQHERRHLRLAVLARAEKLARAAQLQILLSDDKTVVGGNQRFEPFGSARPSGNTSFPVRRGRRAREAGAAGPIRSAPPLQ